MIDSNGLRDVACPPVNTQVRCDDVDDGDDGDGGGVDDDDDGDGGGVDNGDDGGYDGDADETICSLSSC